MQLLKPFGGVELYLVALYPFPQKRSLAAAAYWFHPNSFVVLLNKVRFILYPIP